MKKLSNIVILMCTLLILFSANILYFEAAALTVAETSKVTATSTANKVTLSWKKASKVTGYRVYQRVNGKWKKIKTLSGTKYTVKNLTASESYEFSVRTYRKHNDKTYWSKVFKSVKIKTKNMGSTPTPIATAKKNSVTLKWNSVAGATGYRVFQYKNGKWVKIKTLTANTLTLKSLKSSTTYKFKIRPYEKTSKKVYLGKYSKICSVKTLSNDVTLVKPLNLTGNPGQAQSKNSLKFQSLFDFAYGELDIYKATQNGLKYSQKFSGSEEDADIINEYVKLLTSGKMKFSECDAYYADYGSEIFASWGFTYNGNKNVINNCSSLFSSAQTPCALSVYYMIDGDDVEGCLSWSASLTSTDLGFRAGGKTVKSLAPGGKSACAGLIKRDSGKYETSDKRFSVKLNEAAMRVNNGAAKKCTFEYVDKDTSDILKIKDNNGRDIITLFFSQLTELRTGQIYDIEDIYAKYQHSGSMYPMKVDNPRLYQYVGSTWLTPTYTESPYLDATIRTVYYNEKTKVAVFYIYTSIIDKTEFFCVVDLSKATDETQTSSGGGGGTVVSPGTSSNSTVSCGVCNGSGRCKTCGGGGYLYSSASHKTDRICYGCTATGRCIYCGGDGRL